MPVVCPKRVATNCHNGSVTAKKPRLSSAGCHESTIPEHRSRSIAGMEESELSGVQYERSNPCAVQEEQDYPVTGIPEFDFENSEMRKKLSRYLSEHPDFLQTLNASAQSCQIDLNESSNNNQSTHSRTDQEKPYEKKSWLREWETKCVRGLPLLTEFFSVSTIRLLFPGTCTRVLCSSLTGFAGDTRVDEVIDKVCSTFQGLRFSKMNGKAKNVWSCTEGIVQTQLRCSVAISTIAFVHSQATRLVKEIRPETEVEIPRWISSSIISLEDVHSTSSRLFGKGGTWGKNLKSQNPTDRQLAAFACDFLFKRIGGMIKNCRRRLVKAFFVQIGYTMVDWSNYPVRLGNQTFEVKQSSLMLAFTSSNDIVDDKLMGIPSTYTSESLDSIEEIDRRNMELYDDCKRKLHRFCTQITHDVVERNGLAYSLGARTRTLSMISVAGKLLVNFSYASGIEEILRGDSNSLRTIFALACAIKYMVREFAKRLAAHKGPGIPDVKGINVGALSLASLIPYHSIITELFSSSKLLTDVVRE